jgi:hypothetical protein
MDDRLPEPAPSGALVPPPVHPPTALATTAPLSPRRRDETLVEARGVIERVLTRALDTLDSVGDSIAAAVGLR